jgi:hypothetical protein
MGAALLAAYGVGLVGEDAVRRGWVTLAPRAAPRPGETDRYDRMFDAYKALYPALKATMHGLHEQRAGAEPVVGSDVVRTRTNGPASSSAEYDRRD